jgi:tripartite-type tricarboxylate transporter receptor subunit TctC
MTRWLVLVLLLLGVGGARAEDYPTRAVRIVVPWAAGGVADIAARALADDMRESLGQAVIVDNRPGASGKIGTQAVQHAAPDGYTLLLAVPSGQTLPTVIDKDLGYDPVADFKPIAQLSSSTYFLVVRPSLPVASAAELIAYARAHPNRLSYGSIGNGSSTHLAGAMLATAAKIDIVHVPYKGEAPVVQDMLAGQLDIAFVIDARAHVAAGKVRVLGTTAPAPWFTLPDVPSLGAILPGFKFLAWQGLLAPAGTPDAITDKLNAAVNKSVAGGKLAGVLTQQGFKPVGGAPAVLARTIEEDLRTVRQAVADAHLTFDN